ncbi:MAG TPA: hypothetical protein VLD37_07585 [Candidatus Bilamarchaeum sp.]|nr:hypothetical protein [Candidatus Bilamarchaeum sp.]
MPSKKKTAKTAAAHDDSHLPGALLLGLGLLALPINFDLVPGLEVAKAYPILVSLLGIVMLVASRLEKKL